MDPNLPSAPPRGSVDAPRDTFTEVDLAALPPSGASVSWGSFISRPDEGPGARDDGGPKGNDDAAAFSVLRDILVGEYMVKYERRFDQIEVRLASEIEGFRREIVGLAENVQRQVALDVDKIERLLKGEREERVKEAARVDKRYRAVSDGLQAAIERTARDAEAGAARLGLELREEMAHERRAFGERADAIERHLKSVAAGLGDEKVDRASLEVLFEQLAEHFRSGAPLSSVPIPEPRYKAGGLG